MSSGAEKAKLAALEKKRKAMLESFATQKSELIAETARNRTGSDRFTSKTDGVEDSLKRSTYGLVQLSDFKETREKLEEAARREAAGTSELKEDDKKKKKKKKEGKVKLSFAMDGEEEDGEDSRASVGRKVVESAQASAEGTPTGDDEDDRPSKKARLGKNPAVDTYFLPDREREEAERKDRDELRTKWLRMQEDMKKEDIEITYSYWDGNGHRKVVTCTKGDTIAMFLEKCRQQFPELRSVSVDNLMYIKEDLIIPHHYTFYDFIVNKYRGMSGPMFNFDVHDDVRLIADATIEKDESHAGKVVERSWYNRSKHIFPASRWEVFNPDVARTKLSGNNDSELYIERGDVDTGQREGAVTLRQHQLGGAHRASGEAHRKHSIDSLTHHLRRWINADKINRRQWICSWTGRWRFPRDETQTAPYFFSASCTATPRGETSVIVLSPCAPVLFGRRFFPGFLFCQVMTFSTSLGKPSLRQRFEIWVVWIVTFLSVVLLALDWWSVYNFGVLHAGDVLYPFVWHACDYLQTPIAVTMSAACQLWFLDRAVRVAGKNYYLGFIGLLPIVAEVGAGFALCIVGILKGRDPAYYHVLASLLLLWNWSAAGADFIACAVLCWKVRQLSQLNNSPLSNGSPVWNVVRLSFSTATLCALCAIAGGTLYKLTWTTANHWLPFSLLLPRLSGVSCLLTINHRNRYRSQGNVVARLEPVAFKGYDVSPTVCSKAWPVNSRDFPIGFSGEGIEEAVEVLSFTPKELNNPRPYYRRQQSDLHFSEIGSAGDLERALRDFQRETPAGVFPTIDSVSISTVEVASPSQKRPSLANQPRRGSGIFVDTEVSHSVEDRRLSV